MYIEFTGEMGLGNKISLAKLRKKTNETEEEDRISLRKIGDTGPGISTKSSQSQSSQVESNNAPEPPRKPKNVARNNEAS